MQDKVGWHGFGHGVQELDSHYGNKAFLASGFSLLQGGNLKSGLYHSISEIYPAV